MTQPKISSRQLSDSGAVPGSYTSANITVDASGRITAAANGGGSGGGSVSSVSVVTANGVSGSVATATTTPAISLTLGAITPTSVAATGAVSGANLSGTNTGDQTITLTGDITGTGTGSFAATLANTAVAAGSYTNANITVDSKGRIISAASGGGGGGTVTTVSVVTANGVSGSVATSTTTPAISLTLGAITPTSVAATGTVTGTNLSGTNTGNQTITLTGDVTGSGTGSFAATLANTAVAPGAYTSANVTVDSKGRLTAAANGASGVTVWSPATLYSVGQPVIAPDGNLVDAFVTHTSSTFFDARQWIYPTDDGATVIDFTQLPDGPLESARPLRGHLSQFGTPEAQWPKWLIKDGTLQENSANPSTEVIYFQGSLVDSRQLVQHLWCVFDIPSGTLIDSNGITLLTPVNSWPAGISAGIHWSFLPRIGASYAGRLDSGPYDAPGVSNGPTYVPLFEPRGKRHRLDITINRFTGQMTGYMNGQLVTQYTDIDVATFIRSHAMAEIAGNNFKILELGMSPRLPNFALDGTPRNTYASTNNFTPLSILTTTWQKVYDLVVGYDAGGAVIVDYFPLIEVTGGNVEMELAPTGGAGPPVPLFYAQVIARAPTSCRVAFSSMRIGVPGTTEDISIWARISAGGNGIIRDNTYGNTQGGPRWYPATASQALRATNNAIVADWLSRVTAAGGVPEPGMLDAVTDLVNGLQADGTWTKISDMHILAGVNTLAGALVPIKTSVGLISLNSVGFIQSDYVASGIDCGLNDYANTKYQGHFPTPRPTSLNVGAIALQSNMAYGIWAQGGTALQPATGAFPNIYQSNVTNVGAGLYSFGGNDFMQAPARLAGDIIAVRQSSTSARLYVNGAQIASVGGTVTGTPGSGVLQLAQFGAGNSACGARRPSTAYFFAPNTTYTEALSIRARINTALDAIGYTNGIRSFVYEGDSITEGYNGAESYVTRLRTLSGWQGRHVNAALSGQQLADANTAYPNQGQPFRPDSTYSTKGLIFLFMGTNDLVNGATAATAFSRMQTFWSTARTDGFKVIAFTITPRADGAWTGAMETQRLALNASIIGASANYDVLIRTELLFPNPNDLTYYQADRLHLTTVAGNLLADTIAAQVNPATI